MDYQRILIVLANIPFPFEFVIEADGQETNIRQVKLGDGWRKLIYDRSIDTISRETLTGG
jgi:hypothetical protein